MELFAGKGSNGVAFLGEKGAALRRSTFGRQWREVRTAVGVPEGFRLYADQRSGPNLARGE
jgi:hypothetical protein